MQPLDLSRTTLVPPARGDSYYSTTVGGAGNDGGAGTRQIFAINNATRKYVPVFLSSFVDVCRVVD